MFRMCKQMKRGLDSVVASFNDVPKGIKLVYYWFPVHLNGFTKIGSKKGRQYTIGINLYRAATSSEMRLLYLCATLFHEIEHIRLYENIKNPCSTIERWYIKAEHTATSIGRGFMPGRFAVINSQEKKHRRNVQYQTSATELHCIYCGYVNALKYMRDRLSVTEWEKIRIICESVSFGIRHLEIDYSQKNAPVNKFLYWMKALEKKCKKEGIPPSEGCLGLLYHDDWNRKTLSDLFAQRDGINVDLIDSLLLRVFMYSELDFKQEFQKNPPLRCHMEALIEEYIKKLASYAENHCMASVYFSDEVVKDNNAMIMKEVFLLKKRAKQYTLAGTEPVVVLK